MLKSAMLLERILLASKYFRQIKKNENAVTVFSTDILKYVFVILAPYKIIHKDKNEAIQNPSWQAIALKLKIPRGL